jgi:hypothetical protein
MRLFFCTTLVFASAVALRAPGLSAQSGTASPDPWVGTYTKYNRGPYGDPQQVRITITKGTDGYYLSKPYDGRKFTEIEKGVLSDGNGGIGKIYLGSGVFADGARVRILRADFCYEQFILYDGREDSVQTQTKGK